MIDPICILEQPLRMLCGEKTEREKAEESVQRPLQSIHGQADKEAGQKGEMPGRWK